MGGGLVVAALTFGYGCYALNKNLGNGAAIPGFWASTLGLLATTVSLQIKHEDWEFHAIASRATKLVEANGMPTEHIDPSGQEIKHPGKSAVRHNVNQLTQGLAMLILAGGFVCGIAAAFSRQQVNASIVSGLGLLATGCAFGLAYYRANEIINSRDAIQGLFSTAERTRNAAIYTLQGADDSRAARMEEGESAMAGAGVGAGAR